MNLLDVNKGQQQKDRSLLLSFIYTSVTVNKC